MTLLMPLSMVKQNEWLHLGIWCCHHLPYLCDVGCLMARFYPINEQAKFGWFLCDSCAFESNLHEIAEGLVAGSCDTCRKEG